MKRLTLTVILAAAAFAQFGLAQSINMRSTQEKFEVRVVTYEVPVGSGAPASSAPCAYGLWVSLATKDPSVDAFRVQGQVILNDGRLVEFDEYINYSARGQHSGRLVVQPGQSEPRALNYIIVTPHQAGTSIRITAS
jgi:hypothetical protein